MAEAFRSNGDNDSGLSPPMDRYIQVVAVCNNLALLVSQSTSIRFVQRITLLKSLQQHWQKDYKVILTVVSEEEEEGVREEQSNADIKPNLNDITSRDVATLRGIATCAARKTTDKSVFEEGNKGNVGGAAKQEDIEEMESEILSRANTVLKNFEGLHEDDDMTDVEEIADHIDDDTDVEETEKVEEVQNNDEEPNNSMKVEELEDEEDLDDDDDEEYVPASKKKRKRPEPRSRRGRVEPLSKRRVLEKKQKEINAKLETVVKRRLPGENEPRERRSEKVIAQSDVHPRTDGEDVSARTTKRDGSQAVTPVDRKSPGGAFNCIECKDPFKSLAQLRKHQRDKHALYDGQTSAFDCPDCGKRFCDTPGLRRHLMIHERTHICTVCQKSFAYPFTLRMHIRDKHNNAEVRTVSCGQCGKNFINALRLSKHLQIHSRPHACLICQATFAYSHRLRAHLDEHNLRQELSCTHCRVTFPSNASLTEHMKVHEKTFKCNDCEKVFSHRYKVSYHAQQMHAGNNNQSKARPFMCSECGKCFVKRFQLAEHMKVHTGERRFKCNICDKMFIQSSGLTDHMKVHTGYKPYICSECGKGYARSTQLKYHIRIHTGERPLSCNVCDKTFVYPQKLFVHKKIHTEDAMHECHECDARFKMKSSLSRHLRIHSNEKRHICNMCGRGFNQSGNLKSHMRTHTRERPYSCDNCELTFPHQSSWKKHLEYHLL